jgi:hypothetical protein
MSLLTTSKGRNGGGPGLVDLLEDLAVPNAFLVAFNDLIISDAYTGVAVLEEPVCVVAEPFIGLHGDSAEVEGVHRAIVGRLEVGREGLRQVDPEGDVVGPEVVELEWRCVTHHQREVRLNVVEVATCRLDRDIVG